jgi:S-DNA-T family DNA segregation ATPase FtsK/SpoIIIE
MKRPKPEAPETPEVEEIVEEDEEAEEEDENEIQEEEDFFRAEKKTVITPVTNSLRADRPAPIMQDIVKDEFDEEGPEPFLISREPTAPINQVEEISFEIKKAVPTPEVAINPLVQEQNTSVELDINPIIPAAAASPILAFEPAIEPSNDFEIEMPPIDIENAPKPNFELNAPISDMEVEMPKIEEELSDDELGNKLQEFGPYDPKLDLSRYEPPSIELLKNHGSGVPQINKEELEANKNKIVETLNHYKIEIDKIKATVGPTVTLYEIVPAPGVRISKIKNLEDDIALSLAALGIRIIAPIPGKGTIGIEVPNSRPDIVSMRSLIASEKFQNNDMELPVVLGKTISNENFVADLAKMPHLLMAGATGQGKSVGLNAILVSLLYKKHPSQIKFVLVDPKKVELTLFNKIERHFLAKLPDTDEAIITDTSKVVRTLNSLCIEMDDRYELLKIAQCRNIKEYNAKFISRKLNPENGHRYLPYIVLVVDEFADLIMTAGREVETPIARLAQLARAIGIHLIIATQRPSVNIITGTIKANFPARIAFRVTSKIDSRTILDAGGADQLIGRGDMLFSTGNDLIRIQCGFVDTPEVEEITDFIGSQQGYPSALLLPEVPDESGNTELSFSEEDRDSLFEEAARIVVMTQQGSASLLQRKLKLGYNRAGRLVDQLEAAGIIGPFEGSKARKVLIPDEITLQRLLDSMR